MKKLLVIALALFTLNGVAQEKMKKSSDRKNRMEKMKDISPEDMADLKSKKLTLQLDLTDAQQQKVRDLILKQATANKNQRKDHTAEGEKREKTSKEERIEMQKQRLDQQIAMKREMKTILNADQYAKFEKIQPRKNKRKRKQRKKQS